MKIIIVIFYQPIWDVDVFAHIWYDESWVGSYFFGISTKIEVDGMPELIPFMKENGNQKSEFEEPKQFESDWQPDPRFPHPVNNIISIMFYSLERNNVS